MARCTVRHLRGSGAEAACPDHGSGIKDPGRTLSRASTASRPPEPETLAGDASRDEAAAEHPLTEPHELDALAKTSGSWIVRDKVAKHPNTPPATLDVLASDRSDDVRASVVAHENTGVYTLIRMYAFDRNEGILNSIRDRLVVGPRSEDKLNFLRVQRAKAHERPAADERVGVLGDGRNSD